MMIEVSRPPEYARTTFSDNGIPPLPAMRAAAQQHDENSFLDMQPVLRFIEDDRPRRIDDRCRDLIAPMCRKTVHEERVLRGMRHQFAVHLVRSESLLPLCGFRFFPHARPHVR